MSRPDRFPEDYTLITLEQIQAGLTSNVNSIELLLAQLQDIYSCTPIAAYDRLMEVFRILTERNLWSITKNNQKLNQRYLGGLQRVYSSLRSYADQDNHPGLMYPKLKNIVLSERDRCLQLEPEARDFLSSLYNALKRVNMHMASVLNASSGVYLPAHQSIPFMSKYSGESSKSEKILLNPVMNELYYHLLQSNAQVYTSLVKLTRYYGLNRYLICQNTLEENIEYATRLNEELSRLDLQAINREWLELNEMDLHRSRAGASFRDQRSEMEQIFRRSVRSIRIIKAIDAETLSRMNCRDMLDYFSQIDQFLQSIILLTESMRAYAIMQTTYARVKLEQQLQGRARTVA